MLVKILPKIKNHNKIYAFGNLFYQNKIALYSAYLFLGLILLSLFSKFIAPYNSDQQFVHQVMLPPYWHNDGVIDHLLGTDALGRDVLSRLLIGSIYTFGSSLVVTAVVAIFGGVIGIYAGFSFHKRNQIWLKFFESFSTLPTLFTAIIITSLTKASLINVMIAVFLSLLPSFIFEIAHSFSKSINAGNILLLRLDGANRWQLLQACFMPTVGLKFLRELNKVFMVAMIDILALNFLSLGASSGSCEWGVIIKESLHLIFISPWNVAIPGITVSIIIIIGYILNNGICSTIEKLYE